MWSIPVCIVAVFSWWILQFLLFFGEWLRSAYKFLVWDRPLIRKDDKKALDEKKNVNE